MLQYYNDVMLQDLWSCRIQYQIIYSITLEGMCLQWLASFTTYDYNNACKYKYKQ